MTVDSDRPPGPRRAWIISGTLPMSVIRIPVRVEANRDGLMGYHGWSSIRKGETVTLLEDTMGGAKDIWRLVEFAGDRYWVSVLNLKEILA